MADWVFGLLGVLTGFILWFGGRQKGRQEAAAKRTPETTEAQRRALEQAFLEQMNFLNFEGDEMRPAHFPGSTGQK